MENLKTTRKDENAMAFIPVANTVMAEIRAVLFGQAVENTLYFEHLTGDPTISDMEDLADYLSAWVTGDFSNNMSLDYSFREIYLTNLTTSTSPTFALAISDAGALLGDSLPSSSCICMSFRTAERGRSARGRNYVSGLTESEVTGNTLSLTRADALVDAYGAIPTYLLSGNWEWVVVSRYTDGAPRVSGVTIPVTTVTYADRFLDSQRRRLTGRGS